MTFMTSVSEPSLWRSSSAELSWCWNIATVLQTAIAFSSSLIPSLMKDFFHASSVETSGTLPDVTLTWQTTPAEPACFDRVSWAQRSGAATTKTAAHRRRERMETGPS